jgi:hypothetical protein
MEFLHREGSSLFAGCTHGGIFDISKAFYHIDIAPGSQTYLGCEWLRVFYCYTFLPMGITSAPGIFTEVVNPMVQSWRAMGIRVMQYLDDFPSGALSSIQYRLHSHYMVEHMTSLGFILKMVKLVGYPEPAPAVFALGCLVSFTAQSFSLNHEQITEILSLVVGLLSVRVCPVKQLARLAGLLVSRTHCLGPAARMRTRSMYQNIEEHLRPQEPRHRSWSRHLHICSTTKAELQFWVEHIQRVNGQPFQRALIRRVLHIDLDTDASQNGWGAVLYLPDPTQAPDPLLLEAAIQGLPCGMSLQAITTALHHGICICGLLSQAEAGESSNARELLATLYTYQALRPFLSHLHINHHMDNLGAVQALGGIIPAYAEHITGGSKTPRIQDIVIQIDDFCIDANIDRHTLWVPRNLNTIADYMSKFGTGDKFSFTVQPWVRDLLDSSFGTHTIDRFASRNNVQVFPPRYNSLFFEPEAEWLDAFSCHWTWGPQRQHENNWIHPPYKLTGQVIQHLRLCGAQGTIILPRWEHAPWWPSVRSLLQLPHCSLVELGLAPHVLCFPANSPYDHTSLPRGHIIAIRVTIPTAESRLSR